MIKIGRIVHGGKGVRCQWVFERGEGYRTLVVLSDTSDFDVVVVLARIPRF